MKKTFVIFILTFSTNIIFSQTNMPKQTENSKPFVLGIIDELQLKELAEKTMFY